MSGRNKRNRNRSDKQDDKHKPNWWAVVKAGAISCGFALMCSLAYRGDVMMLLIHGAFVCAHMFIFGVKRYTVGNFNGFDLLFGCFYLYFWWQNPIGFMIGYFYWAMVVFCLFGSKPLYDPTSA